MLVCLFTFALFQSIGTRQCSFQASCPGLESVEWCGVGVVWCMVVVEMCHPHHHHLLLLRRPCPWSGDSSVDCHSAVVGKGAAVPVDAATVRALSMVSTAAMTTAAMVTISAAVVMASALGDEARSTTRWQVCSIDRVASYH